jgi:hypothetical protein
MRNRWLVFGLVLAPLLATGDAHGADGVIEINQARALAGGVTIADLPGFPVTLVPNASYVLTSDLVITDALTDVIEDEGAGFSGTGAIHLDLNGFSIRCENPVPNCGGGFTVGGGIKFDNVRGATIENGSIHHLKGTGIDLVVRGARIDRVHAYANGGVGIACSSSCLVTNSTANENGAGGIRVESRSSVLGCIAEGNVSHGISVGRDSNVRDSTSVGNTGNGINLANLGAAPFGYGGNVLIGNGGTVPASGVQNGANVCETNAICP